MLPVCVYHNKMKLWNIKNMKTSFESNMVPTMRVTENSSGKVLFPVEKFVIIFSYILYYSRSSSLFFWATIFNSFFIVIKKFLMCFNLLKNRFCTKIIARSPKRVYTKKIKSLDRNILKFIVYIRSFQSRNCKLADIFKYFFT